MNQDDLKNILPLDLVQQGTPYAASYTQKCMDDPRYGDYFKETFLANLDLMYKVKSNQVMVYIKSVKYFCLKLIGFNNLLAWKAISPEKIKVLEELGQADDTTLVKLANAYNNTNIVVKLFERNIVPAWITNQSTYLKALNVQVDLMMNSRDHIKQKAADSLMLHLKPPEALKIDVNMNDSNGINPIDQLRHETSLLVKEQLEYLASNKIKIKDLVAIQLPGEKDSIIVDNSNND